MLQALGGYLKAAQMVLVCVDLEDLGGVASEAQRLLAQVTQAGNVLSREHDKTSIYILNIYIYTYVCIIIYLI